jgi:hypothetical protein
MQRIVGTVCMARKKPAPVQQANEQPEKRKQVSVDADLVRMGNILASVDGVSLPDLINNLLRPVMTERLRIVLRGISEEFPSIMDKR